MLHLASYGFSFSWNSMSSFSKIALSSLDLGYSDFFSPLLFVLKASPLSKTQKTDLCRPVSLLASRHLSDQVEVAVHRLLFIWYLWILIYLTFRLFSRSTLQNPSRCNLILVPNMEDVKTTYLNFTLPFGVVLRTHKDKNGSGLTFWRNVTSHFFTNTTYLPNPPTTFRKS